MELRGLRSDSTEADQAQTPGAGGVVYNNTNFTSSVFTIGNLVLVFIILIILVNYVFLQRVVIILVD